MHHDDAEALNRALDELATGGPVSGNEVDPGVLATVQWLDDLGRQVSPDPSFVARLEQKLLNDVVPERPAVDASETGAATWRSRMRGWSHRVIPVPKRMPEWRWAGTLVWVSWVIVVGLVAFALIGPLQLLPGGSDDDRPAMSPGFPLELDSPVDLASHPIVGSWRLEPDPGLPIFVIFHADGSYVEVDPLQGTGVGVWRPTDERSGEVVVVWPNRNAPGRLATPDPSGIGAKIAPEHLEGRSTLRSTFTVSADGTSFTGTYRLQQFLPNGDRDPVEPEGSLTGTRISFDPATDTVSVNLATHPIVGAWTLVPEVGPPSVVAFHADGTYVEVSPLQGTGVGVWRATDERSGEVLVEWPNRNDSGRVQAALVEDGYLEGRTTLESTFTVGDDGITFSGEYRMQRYYPNGVTYHGEDSAAITGTRIVADSPDDTVDLATHPIVGTWIPSATPARPVGLTVFHADGSVTAVNEWAGAGVGVWRATDEGSGGLIIQWPIRNLEPTDHQEGRTILTGTVTVAEDGSTFAGTHYIELFSPDSSQPVERFDSRVEGNRITLDQIEAATPEA